MRKAGGLMEETAKKQRRKYQMTYVCPKHLENRETICGERMEHNVQVGTLPAIGDTVYIYINKDLYHQRPLKAKDGTIITGFYHLDSDYGYYDGQVFRPWSYEVLEYSKGIENAMDYGNWIKLYHHYPNGGGFITSIKAVYVAIGCYYLCSVSNDLHEEIRERLVSHYKGEKVGCPVEEKIKIEV